jgi:hypothetical protein
MCWRPTGILPHSSGSVSGVPWHLSLPDVSGWSRLDFGGLGVDDALRDEAASVQNCSSRSHRFFAGRRAEQRTWPVARPLTSRACWLDEIVYDRTGLPTHWPAPAPTIRSSPWRKTCGHRRSSPDCALLHRLPRDKSSLSKESLPALGLVLA